MFGKFMNKKFFHPGSYPNVKMRWIHEQRDAAKKKNEEEKQATYQKEQESYQSRMLSAKSNEEKMKLDLNFLYDLPPGMKTKDEDVDNEKDVKFEWQKHAPRSRYVNDLGLECADQPFGVCVRNIRCFKCREWGHQNTDRECPLFFADINSEQNSMDKKSDQNLRLSDPLRLVSAMKKQHGLSLKKSVIGQEIDPMAENQQLIASDDENGELNEADFEFIESLTDKQKLKLLKHLNKLDKKEKKSETKKAGKEKSDNCLSISQDKKYRKQCIETKRKYSSSGSSADDIKGSKSYFSCHSKSMHIPTNSKNVKQQIMYSSSHHERDSESPKRHFSHREYTNQQNGYISNRKDTIKIKKYRGEGYVKRLERHFDSDEGDIRRRKRYISKDEVETRRKKYISSRSSSRKR